MGAFLGDWSEHHKHLRSILLSDFQKVAAQIHEFLLKLSDELECAELRDALNLTLLQLQRYYRSIRSRSMIIDQSINVSGSGFLSRSLRGMSPMTPFRDAPDKFIWKWVDLENVRSVGATLPARLDKEESAVPSVIRAAKQGDNNLLLQLTEKGGDYNGQICFSVGLILWK